MFAEPGTGVVYPSVDGGAIDAERNLYMPGAVSAVRRLSFVGQVVVEEPAGVFDHQCTPI